MPAQLAALDTRAQHLGERFDAGQVVGDYDVGNRGVHREATPGNRFKLVDCAEVPAGTANGDKVAPARRLQGRRAGQGAPSGGPGHREGRFPHKGAIGGEGREGTPVRSDPRQPVKLIERVTPTVPGEPTGAERVRRGRPMSRS